MADEVRRAILKERAALRAMFNYNLALERIDFNMDVIQPRERELKFKALNGDLPEIQPININEYTTNNS